MSEFGYKPLQEETIVHSLFGNVRSAENNHKVYQAHLI